MANGARTITFSEREDIRENSFNHVWTEELDHVFADVATYYDRANSVASLGLWDYFREQFLEMIELHPGQKALDVCAGTNAIGIAMLKKQPELQVTAIDRSQAMQEVGRKLAGEQGLHIESTIGDVHHLPFPDNHFDVVTLQFASRHLRVVEVFTEIKRVLKPGGHFYHSDMLRPGNWLSGPWALNCRDYFMNALNMFYSAEELTDLLSHLGYQDIKCKTLMGGLLGYHRAMNGKKS